jgi:chromosome segregation ATPase
MAFYHNRYKMFEKFKKTEDSQQSADMLEQEKPTVEAERIAEQSGSGSEIGIADLMSKRAKLEEAIDYVGLMIKNLKDKRTRLVKEIEDESVDIQNLKEKLTKVSDYIEEEGRGIRDLSNKRAQVEKQADEVGALISNLRSKLASIDSVVEGEENKVKSIKESRQKI